VTPVAASSAQLEPGLLAPPGIAGETVFVAAGHCIYVLH